ncbi:ParB-like partition protein [Hyella patelloides LEGE 07179]|uniref:ParB-like partition protein n=1 Tax=Hyella patelloides LEGE 07179 TaxID=945734 RepID=A0A563W2A6_9CYAN|nr:ParB/RepB/Spo0J family partition protein [Hyella patelloides]VEP17806.1 ParB-like partition protein [Hyella patelloides LEGE 07179]
MSPRKSNKTFGGKITTPTPSWLSETESHLVRADSLLVKLSDIHRPKEQPRRYFDPTALQELVASIKLHGILQPLLVRPLTQGGYELVAGERRYRAATEAQLSSVPVVIKELDDESAIAISLIENLQREDLNPLEETEGILQLLAIKFKSELEEVPLTLYRLQKGLKNRDNSLSGEPIIESFDDEKESSHNVMGNSESPQSNINDEELSIVEEVFNGLGLMNWESFVKNRLPLLNLPEDIKLALREGKIAYTKAKAIASLKEEASRVTLLAEAIEKQLSLSQIKERIKELQPTSPSQSQEIPERLKAAYQQVKKTRIWEDKKKRRQLETLLNKLEALIGQTNKE